MPLTRAWDMGKDSLAGYGKIMDNAGIEEILRTTEDQ